MKIVSARWRVRPALIPDGKGKWLTTNEARFEYVVRHPKTRDWPAHSEECVIIIHKDFKSDLASIPPLIPRWLIDKERCRSAGCAHDYLYGAAGAPMRVCDGRHGWSRAAADVIFRLLLNDEEFPNHRIVGFMFHAIGKRGAWAAVRLCGWLFFRRKTS